MSQRDFTQAQAKRWIAQELAKHPTKESALARIESELRSMALFEEAGLNGKLPISHFAHCELVAQLREKFGL